MDKTTREKNLEYFNKRCEDAQKDYRKKLFAWFIDDCQWGPRAMQDDNPRAEVPSVEDLESEWRSDHGG